MNITLSGISFADLPHISNKSRSVSGELVKGVEGFVTRETGKPWDSDGYPAYSVRINSMHVGYIPLRQTVMEEIIRAKDGFVKVWKDGYAEMTKEQLRDASARIIAGGELQNFHDWNYVGKAEARKRLQGFQKKIDTVDIIRDALYVDMQLNHLTPCCHISAVYYDDKYGRNFDEIGDICSVCAAFNDYY